MRRSRRVDWLLLGTLLPLFLAMLVGGIHAHRASGGHVLPFRVTGAQGADGYPIVRRLRLSLSEIRPGDRILRIGEVDLRGLTEFEVRYRTRTLLAAGDPIAVQGERQGARFQTAIEPVPLRSWWWPLPSWCAFVLAGSFLLVRAPHWHLRRMFFVVMLAWACFGISLGDTHPIEKTIGSVMALPLAQAVGLWLFLSWAQKGRPGRVGQALAWGLGLSWLVVQLDFVLRLPTGTLQDGLIGALAITSLPIYLGAVVQTYRRSEPLERRQLRWILYGHFVGLVPIALVYFAAALVPQFDERFFTFGWSLGGVIPLGYAVAIVGYGWLDIDRVISASAAATVLGVALVGGLLAVVPPVASAASTTLGIDPETGRLALSMGLAGVLVPAYRRLRPWLDRHLFAEQHALARASSN